ncbi:TspO/MBR family protein [Pseudoduganella umbonata]|uniref:Tryptophan-rich sensory protein n=1 Tax=Pseudoduganella umbonata TaxID=864828 RepID=A0A4P8HN04_9BURK|nr:TspO/MBR family protein [Pseudoduganella umbonata]MBB3219697.1 tryptophan-rich sensory protein [Pseudoduganella umbonata]QCP09750.1 tryptophan-rich sensory protein [Pseudoduganella umbonata]
MDTHRLADNIKHLAGWLLVTFAAAALGAWASQDAPQFYAQLSKPDWAPPAGVFGPVWTALYLLMAIAAFLVWRMRGFSTAPRTLWLYLVQLAANALWSWLFFAWHLGGAAFAEVLLLWALVLATTVAFWKARRIAGVMLLPYLVWVTFAAGLTFACWQRNPQLLG